MNFTTEVMLVCLSKMLLLDVLNGDKTEISYQSNYYAGPAEFFFWGWGGGVDSSKRRSFREEEFASMRAKSWGANTPLSTQGPVPYNKFGLENIE